MSTLSTKSANVLCSLIQNMPKTFPVFVAVKIVSRSYGGPEEGGWYYDSDIRYENVQTVRTEQEFLYLCRDLAEIWDLRAPFADRLPSRWDSRDCQYNRIWYGEKIPQNESIPRPRYE